MNNNIIIRSSDNPISLNLVNYGDKVNSIKLISATIPNVSYNLLDTDYIIFKNTSGVNNNIYFNNGRYDISLLITYLQTKLNSLDVVSYVITNNVLTNKLEFDNSNTGGFSITAKTANVEYALGLILNKLYNSISGVIIPDNIFNFTYTSCYYIYSNIINNNSATYINQGKTLIANQSILGILPNSGAVNSFSYSYWGNLNDNIRTNGSPNNINITIYDDLNNIVNFNGLKYTIFININNTN
jgi:hypothetical protein